MNFEIHKDFPQELKEEWNQLTALSFAEGPFMRFESLKNWWDERGGGEWPQEAELLIITARRDGELLGIAPLFFTVNQGYASLMLLGSHEVFDYLDIIVHPNNLPEFISGLLQFLDKMELPRWKNIDLYNLLQNSPSLHVLEKEALRNGWQYRLEELQPSPYITLNGDWDAYLAGIKKKQRHEIRRKIRRFEELEGEKHWYTVEDSARLHDEMEVFLDLMQQDREKNEFLTPTMREFMHKSARTAFENGYLRLAFLELNGEKLAGKLAFDYDDKLWLYNSCVNYDHIQKSPGWVLLGYMIQWSCENDYGIFDFMRGDEEYKYRFGAVNRYVMRATIQR